MKIVCIGWGSLIWNPSDLKIQRKWFQDGPILPVEFTRISDNKRVTLIIDRESRPVRTLWALMSIDNLNEAQESLRERENTPDISNIHKVEVNEDTKDNLKLEIVSWLKSKKLDAAIWTGLSYNKKYFNGERPPIERIIDHLKGLKKEKRICAEYYIRKAPRQVDTVYRREIEKNFGWTPIGYE